MVNYNFTRLPMPFDQATDELPGLSAFCRAESGEVFHTYSGYARGTEPLFGTLMILDRAPKGRNETRTMDFVRRHDEYQEAAGGCKCQEG